MKPQSRIFVVNNPLIRKRVISYQNSLQRCHAMCCPDLENIGKEWIVLMFANNSNVFKMITIMWIRITIGTVQYWCLIRYTSHVIHQNFPTTCSKYSTWTYMQCTKMRICIIYILLVLCMCNEHLDLLQPCFYPLISFCIDGYSQITKNDTKF